MDKMVGICRRVEKRFTGIRTDIGKLETELLKARDWSARAQDQINRLEMHIHWLEASRRVMRDDMDEMMRNMNGLLELNQRMIQIILQLRMSQVHNRDNPIIEPIQLLFPLWCCVIRYHNIPFGLALTLAYIGRMPQGG